MSKELGVISKVKRVLRKAEAEALYTALIAQLNKDLRMVDIDYEFAADEQPDALWKSFSELIEHFIDKDQTKLVALLYRIDVSEEKLKVRNKDDSALDAQTLAFVILQREWQKGWYRANF